MHHSSFHDEVRIVLYQEEWVQRFRAMKERITALLLKADIACDVRHVGGTAVPGMCSKPIVDVLVTVDKANLEKAVSALSEEILCLGECGRPGRWFFSDGDKEDDAVYIHLTTSDNRVAIDQSAFLDMLLKHPDLQKQYHRCIVEFFSRNCRIFGYFYSLSFTESSRRTTLQIN